jgi:hypothetical protein
MEDPARDDAAYLKSLRQDAGLDLAELAAIANLSAGQIRQLEDGGDSLFYSQQIKAQSLRRVIQLLESPQPSGKPVRVQAAEVSPRSPANVIEDIIRLSEKNFKGHVVTSPVRRPANSAMLLGIGVVLMGLAGLGVLWMTNREVPQSVFSEWVQPLTHHVSNNNPVSADQPAPGTIAKDSTQTSPTSTTTVTSSATATAAVASAPIALTNPPPPPPPLPAPTLPLAASNTAPSVSVPKQDGPAVAALPVAASTPQAAAVESKSQSAAVAAATSDKAVQNDCTSLKGQALSVDLVSATKPGSYVYLQSGKAVQICVEDGIHRRTVVNLEPGVGRSVHGSPPWTVASQELKWVQIYFQGAKVLLPPEADKRILLNERPVAP